MNRPVITQRPSTAPSARLLLRWRRALLLIPALLALNGRSTLAATNLGLYVDRATPNLYLDFGNPTEYMKLIPGPVYLECGLAGNYFGGITTTNLVEIAPVLPPGGPYGGPGDSWSSLLLDSPTPGSTALTPIVYRYSTRIRNLHGAVGYFTGNGSSPGNAWHFAPAGTNVHFRIEWSMDVVGAYEVTNCYPVYLSVPPYMEVVCTNATLQTTGAFSAALYIEGYGPVPIHSGNLGSEGASYSGEVSGVAAVPYLRVAFAHDFYVGQGNRGDQRVNVEYHIYADTEPLPAMILPALRIVRVPPDQVEVSWWPDLPGFVLQEASNLSPSHWSFSPSGSLNPVVLPAAGPTKFFRLISP